MTLLSVLPQMISFCSNTSLNLENFIKSLCLISWLRCLLRYLPNPRCPPRVPEFQPTRSHKVKVVEMIPEPNMLSV